MTANETTRWWSSYDCSINGVFKGGGAKGVLYAGALEAVAERKLWFRAVAGASAGAITATLVAAGIDPLTVRSLASEGLRKIKHNYLFDIVGKPFLQTRDLHAWLEEVLSEQLKSLTPSANSLCPTFEELFTATHIELDVVCVDVATRQPLVFNHVTTPALPVAQAVIASSAIPFAFRPSRLRFGQEGTHQVHRLMDGGLWANYPSFVFKEPSFRQFHRLPPMPADSMTVGFTLDQMSLEEPECPAPVKFEADKSLRHGDVGAGLKGWLRNPLLRVYFFTLAPILMIIQAMWVTSNYGLLVFKDVFAQGNTRMPGWVVSSAAFIDGFFSSFRPALWLMFLGVLAFAFAMLLLGATLIDSAAPAIRTLMAVGTDVPYWIGAADDDFVVRLQVPRELTTLSFKVDPERLDEYIASARDSTSAQLSELLAT